MTIDEPKPKELYSQVPPIWLIPTELNQIRTDLHRYVCPVYKTHDRRGVLSTTV